jgi:PAS domain-containing protein
MQNSQLPSYSAWFGLQTLRSKITLLIAFFIIAFGIITLIVFYENRLTVNINSKGVDVNAPSTITALELTAQVRESQKNLYEYLSNPSNSIIIESDSLWTNHIEPTAQKLYTIAPKFASKTDQQMIESVRADLGAFRQAQNNMIKAFREQINITIGLQERKDSVQTAYERLILEKQARQAANRIYHKQLEPIANHLQKILHNFVKRQQKILNDNFRALESSVQVIDISVLSISLLVAFLGILLGYAVVVNLQKSISLPTRIMKRLAIGELPARITEPQDEFKTITQASNQLVEILRKAGDFAVEIGEGNLQSNFSPISDKDILGNSLVQMREKLKAVSEEDKRRSWATEGYALLGDIVRKNSHDIQILCDQVLTALIEYVGAIQGGVFVYKETEKERYLEMKACYAYGRKKYLQKKIQIHEDYAEALIGQAYLEQEKIYMTHLPAGYTEITSGLGDTTPSALLITPLKTAQRIEGVMEVASLKPLEKHEIEFVERISETIAIAIASAWANMQNVLLLHDTQSQSETMRQQEVVLRQKLIELQIAQDKMGMMQEELEEKEANLVALINSTDESLIAIDTNYEVLVMNEEVRRRYQNTSQSGIDVGKNVLDFLGSVRDDWKAHYDRAFAGDKFDFIKRSQLDGKNTYRHYFVAPLYNREGKITGASVFSRDISAQKNQEDMLEKRIIMLQEKLEYYETLAGHIVLDWQGHLAKVSDGFLQQLGYDSAEIVGKPAAVLGEKVAKLQKSPYWQGEEIEIIDKKGSKHTYMAQRLRRQESLDKQIHYFLFPVVFVNPISARDANN